MVDKTSLLYQLPNLLLQLGALSLQSLVFSQKNIIGRYLYPVLQFAFHSISIPYFALQHSSKCKMTKHSCYGYHTMPSGELIVNEAETRIVRWILTVILLEILNTDHK